jgi:hypothetical protein
MQAQRAVTWCPGSILIRFWTCVQASGGGLLSQVFLVCWGTVLLGCSHAGGWPLGRNFAEFKDVHACATHLFGSCRAGARMCRDEVLYRRLLHGSWSLLAEMLITAGCCLSI